MGRGVRIGHLQNFLPKVILSVVATGNCVTGWHRDDDPLTEVVASLLGGQKNWVFASKGFREANHLSNVKEANKFEKFIEGVVFKRWRGSTYCVEEVRDTVRLLARTAHLVLSVNEKGSWDVLLSHNNFPAVAAKLEIRCWNVTRASKDRIHQGLGGNEGRSLGRGSVLENIAVSKYSGKFNLYSRYD